MLLAYSKRIECQECGEFVDCGITFCDWYEPLIICRDCLIKAVELIHKKGV